MYEQDTLSALDAITEAQRIAFAPMQFQTARCMRNIRVLAYLDACGKLGATLVNITDHTCINEYAVSILLDMGLSGHIVTYKEGHYFIAKVGHFLLHDAMTGVNMDFTHDVCYQGLFFLDRAFKEEEAAGLKVFGDWPTIYPALAQLPEAACESWLAFDHHYSDAAFDAALPYVFASRPETLYDVGGNTGKWALRCCGYDKSVAVTILDLPEQIALAQKNIDNTDFSQRIGLHAVDMLGAAPLPNQADIGWMSQFLDCFSPEQIVSMLNRVTSAMKADARLCIMELFWDVQKFEAAAFSLNASSLYFTCMANGNSRFYSAEKFTRYIEMAGFRVEQRLDNLGVGHSLLICRKI